MNQMPISCHRSGRQVRYPAIIMQIVLMQGLILKLEIAASIVTVPKTMAHLQIIPLYSHNHYTMVIAVSLPIVTTIYIVTMEAVEERINRTIMAFFYDVKHT